MDGGEIVFRVMVWEVFGTEEWLADDQRSFSESGSFVGGVDLLDIVLTAATTL